MCVVHWLAAGTALQHGVAPLDGDTSVRRMMGRGGLCGWGGLGSGIWQVSWGGRRRGTQWWASDWPKYSHQLYTMNGIPLAASTNKCPTPLNAIASTPPP